MIPHRIEPADRLDTFAIRARLTNHYGTQAPWPDIEEMLEVIAMYRARDEAVESALVDYFVDPDPSDAYDVLCRVSEMMGKRQLDPLVAITRRKKREGVKP